MKTLGCYFISILSLISDWKTRDPNVDVTPDTTYCLHFPYEELGINLPVIYFLVGLQAPSARWEKKNQQGTKEFPGTGLQHCMCTAAIFQLEVYLTNTQTKEWNEKCNVQVQKEDGNILQFCSCFNHCVPLSLARSAKLLTVLSSMPSRR